MTAAQSGLYIDGFIGDAHMIPYKGNVQFQPGFKGLMKLARNSGEVSTISAHVVYAGETFEYSRGDDECLTHTGRPDGTGKMDAVYAIATMKDGSKQRAVLWPDEVDNIKKSSHGSSGANSPWVKHPGEMWKKTAIKRLCKMLPMSTEQDSLNRVIAISNGNESGEVININSDGELIGESYVEPLRIDTNSIISMPDEWHPKIPELIETSGLPKAQTDAILRSAIEDGLDSKDVEESISLAASNAKPKKRTRKKRTESKTDEETSDISSLI